MANLRSVLLVLVVFGSGFVGVRWIMAGAPIPIARLVPLKPSAQIETFEQRSRRDIAAQREREWLAAQTSQGDDDPARSRLREDVIAAANAFTGSPCNDSFRQRYFEAAVAYARASATLGGCPNFPACRPGNDALMEHANQVFRSPADARVREAIRAVHDMGIGAKDYPDRLGMVIAHLSDSGHGVGGEFSCANAHLAQPKASDEPHSDRPAPPPRRVDNGPSRREIDRQSREHYRNAALDLLRHRGPALCVDPGRRNLVGGLNQYYGMRDASQHGYAIRSSEEQREIEQAWSTALDEQIDGLVRDFYADGYLRPNDLRKSVTVQRVLAGLTSTNRACASPG